MKENKLDQFYTNPITSDDIVQKMIDMFEGFTTKRFIEPSAGCGNFITSLVKKGVNKKHIIAYDIEPKDFSSIIKSDYLKVKIPYNKNNITIGNPPFGKNGQLALEFLNKSLSESDIVIFILPLLFKRYSMQKKIIKTAKLIAEFTIPNNSFLVNNREYNVNCVLQVWTTDKVKTFLSDIRLKRAPSNKIEGITTYIHNNTKETLKYFNKRKYKWDFAVVRQGYYDYSEKITSPKKLKDNRQYMFFKIDNNELREIIYKVDFEKLSKTNTITPGFSTTDFISEVKRIQIEEYLKNKL